MNAFRSIPEVGNQVMGSMPVGGGNARVASSKPA
jgi:hypothetical protein